MKTRFNEQIIRFAGMIILLVCIAPTAWAQTPQHYNLNTNGINNSFPFSQPSGMEVQWLIPHSNISQPTPAPSGYITTIYFRISDTDPLGPWVYTDLTIKMAQTSDLVFTAGAFHPGPFDTVYFRTSVTLTGAVGQWMPITLDTPFYYDTAQSLIVDVGQCSALGATGYTLCQSSSTDILRTYAVGGCPFVYSGANTRLLHLGLDICVPPPAPTDITPAINLEICSGNSTNLSVSGLGSITWSADSIGGTVLATGPAFSTPVLTTTTTYYVRDSTCTGSFASTPITVVVNDLPIVSFSGLNPSYCHYEPAVTLTGNPLGGTFSGAGVTGNVFNPNLAGAGTFEIIYTYTDINGCTSSDTNSVYVDLCLNVTSENRENFKIFPNPSEGKFSIELKDEAMVEIFDASGKLVFSASFEKGKNPVKLELSDGIYLVKVSDSNGVYEQRMTINH